MAFYRPNFFPFVQATHTAARTLAAPLYNCPPADLHVGWKAVRINGTTHGGYRWPRDGYPVMVTADDPDPSNPGSCPSQKGDGLCVLGETIAPATYGTTVHTLAAAAALTVVWHPGDVLSTAPDVAGKFRVRRCVVTDWWAPLPVIHAGYLMDLTDTNLSGANLSGADLTNAYLEGADLTRADLTGADLTGAIAGQWTRWPVNFDPAAHGVILL